MPNRKELIDFIPILGSTLGPFSAFQTYFGATASAMFTSNTSKMADFFRNYPYYQPPR